MLRTLAKCASLCNAKGSVYKWGQQICHGPPRKFLHACCSMHGKMYLDRENMHAHAVLETSPKSYQIFSKFNDFVESSSINEAILQPDTENISGNQLFDNYKSLCCYCRQTNTFISNNQFANFLKQYCAKMHLLTDDQLKDSLRLLAILPVEESVRSPNFMELWNSLDTECCRRIEKWKTDDLLLICDAWYQLNMARISDFVSEALRKLGRKIVKMQPNQLVQTMFLLNIVRRTVFEMFDFETNLVRSSREMTLAELGVMSMGYFKTQTKIRHPELLNYLYQRLIDELHTVDDITFVAILKVLRYSSKIPQVNLMMTLLDKIFKEKLEGMNLLTSLHVGLLGSDLQCCHDELIEKLLYKFHDNLNTMRLKDLERIVLITSLFNLRTATKIEDAVCEKILQSLRGRIEEILKHPKCFTNCLHFLTLRGFYDKEMLSSALDGKFLKHAVGTNLAVSREIFHLDTFVKVNLKDEGYEGPQLLDRIRKTMGKMLTHYIPERNTKYKLSATDTLLLQIKEVADIFLPHTTFKHILPNYNRWDVVICYDSVQRKSLEISKDCPEDYSGVVLTRELLLGENNRPEFDTVAIVIAGWNNSIREKDRHTGLFDMKLTQLGLLGHKYVVINWYEWRQLETHKDRINFLKRSVSKVIKL